MRRQVTAALSALFLVVATSPATAEVEVSLYMGAGGFGGSNVSGALPGGQPLNEYVNWDNEDSPFYYGGRAIWWTSGNYGFGLEGTRAKGVATEEDRESIGAERFDMSDGLNIFTANVMKSWPRRSFEPYIGAGVGLSVPHAGIRLKGDAADLTAREETGIAARGMVGGKYALSGNWSLFTEYQFTVSDNEIRLESASAGSTADTDSSLKTRLTTHAINFGLSFNF